MFNSKMWIIFQHEYITKLKSKAFLLGTVLVPLGFVAFIGITVAITLLSDKSSKKLAVIDYTNTIGVELVQADTSKYYISGKNLEEIKKDVAAEEADGYLLIPENIIESGEAEVFTSGGGGTGFISDIESKLSLIVRDKRMLQEGIDKNVINIVNKKVSVSTNRITKEGTTEKDQTEAMAFIGYMMGFVIYMLMFIYGGLVLRAVIEEKANRIVEVLASSAKPFDILFGKVVGIGALGLTQIGFWVILFVGVSFFSAQIVGMFVDINPETLTQGATIQQAQQEQIQTIMSDMPDISGWLILGFIFYFLAGYFIYASLFAAVGSAVDQESDAQQLQIPITIPIIIPILLAQPIMENPDGMLATVASLIPFFTPIIMTVRVAATNVPIWQIALSVVLLIATFLGSIWMASKIYRVGILTTGKKPTFKDLWKWIRYS